MADPDVLEPVVEPDSEQPATSEQAEPSGEAPASVDSAPPAEPHPLEPGGERFKQVWARAKAAEETAQREKEERIRAEERAKALAEAQTQQKAEHIYSWAELQAAIDKGQISLADAQQYREEQLRKQMQTEFDRKLNERLTAAQTTSQVSHELTRYKTLLPSIMQPGTTERLKVEQEYAYLIQLGMPAGEKTELAAARAAFGDAGELEQRMRLKQTRREPNMETHGAGRPPTSTTTAKNDPIAKLAPREREHYEKLIKRGVYAGWDEVKSELLWERKPKTS